MHGLKTFLVVVGLVAAGLAASLPVARAAVSLSEEEQAWLAAHPAPLRVHNEQDWRPYNFTENGAPAGFSIDYIRLVADKVGLDIDFVTGPTWAEFMEMMRTGDLDVMLNIASTRDRRRTLTFTEPYYITSVGLYVRRNTTGINDLEDMTGKRLSYPDDFFFDEFIADYYPDIVRAPYPSAPESFRAVAEGAVDAAMDVPGVARSIMARDGLDLAFAGRVSDPRFITTFYMAVRKDEPILRDILQKGMDAVTTAEMNALDERWNLQETGTPAVLFSQEDRSWLAALGSLTACAAPDRLPLEGVDRAGTHTGMAADYAALLSEAFSIPVRVKATDTWRTDDGRPACDIALLGETPTAQAAGMILTTPWLHPDLVVATRDDQIYLSDPGQLAGRSVGVAGGAAVAQTLWHAAPDVQLVSQPSVAAGLAAVADGTLYGLIGDVATLTRALQVDPVDGVKISGGLDLHQTFSIAVRPDSPRLLRLVEAAMGSIAPDQVQALYRRWLAVAYVDRFDYTRLWQGLAAVLALGLYGVYRHRKNLRVTAMLRTAHAEVAAANRALAEKNQELIRLARTDSLTGLANRHAAGEALQREMARFRRYATTVSVVLLDVDHFKEINDTHGHQVGDQVLVRLAALLTAGSRDSDIVGRWGGEEFVLICPETTVDGATRLAEHLRQAVAADRVDGLPPLTVSLGVAEGQEGDDDDSLLARADKALYEAKRTGRDRVCLAAAGTAG